MEKYKKVLVGLDLGTDSVGWCATDENGKIIKKRGKALWGYLGFDEAQSANERRAHRSDRRRYNRRQERILLLREIFSEEIEKVDPSFFYRLDNSFYKNEDRDTKFDYTLFNSLTYTDSQYYSQFPTIYHLRKHLLNSNEKEDIRLIYLAMHHMIKYRGNFLNDAEEFHPMDENTANEYFLELQSNLEQLKKDESNEITIETIPYSNEIYQNLKKINEEFSGINVKKEKLNSLLNSSNNKYLKDVIIPLMVGGELKVSKLGLKNIEGKESLSLCAKKDTFDQVISELLEDNQSQETLIDCFSLCKRIYDFFLVGKLLGKHQFLSDAMVERYEIHNKQLQDLKNYIKNNCPEKYDEMFRNYNPKIANYVAYIGSTIVDGKKLTRVHVQDSKLSSQEAFYSYVKEVLKIKDYKGDDPYLLSVKEAIDNGEYLLRQNSSSNGVFPYQLNKMEMKIILTKQSKYYPFLLEKENDLTNIDKILSIISYKIPYYVGPLISPKENESRSKFSWIERTNEKIYPWNFNQVVRLDKSADNFIKKMLSRCSYLPSCYCLPKNSIIFSYFNVLMNLNKTYINGKEIDYELKMEIIDNLFKVKRKVSRKDLVDYLRATKDEVDLSTSNGKELKEFNCDMCSYVDFVNILGKEFVDNNIELIENIIRDIVIFEDKTILAKRLKDEYGIVNEKILKRIKSLNYSKYSNISKELLTDIKFVEKDDQTGEVFGTYSIISIMEQSNQTLQEVLYNERYNFIELINKYNKKHSPNASYSTIEEYVEDIPYVSPGMKRPMIQAYKICEEIEKIVGQRIDEYYVECTRTNKDRTKGTATSSRQKRLLDMYDEAIRIATGELKQELKEMRKLIIELDANMFRSDKYYLYFTQLGKCLYTGNTINIAELQDDSHFNIDHIYPQSLIKDDSLSNRVLVETKSNEAKGDTYPIPHSILWKGDYKKAKAFYKQLKELKLITEEKYKRLVALELSENELESFVNRQLVYTNQAVKGFINAINYFKTKDDFKPKIVYSKGENVSDFRNKYDIIKSREANNFHHAHDAYLNIIVGRTIDTYFSFYQNKYGRTEYLNWMHEHGLTTNVMNIFDQNKNGTKKDITDPKGNLVWSYNNSLKEVKHNIYDRFDIFSTERTFVGNVFFGKVTILPADQGGNIPVKSKGPLSDPKKYGGFKQYDFGLYSLIKVNDDFIIEPIPTIFKNDVKSYLDSIYPNYEVIINCLKKNTIFEVEKRKFVITGKTGEYYVIKNKNERYFSSKFLHILKKNEKLAKMIQGKITGHETKEEIENQGFAFDGETLLISPSKNDKKAILLNKEEEVFIYESLINTFNKELYNYSSSISIAKKMQEEINTFKNLSILGMNHIIMELIKFLKCNERKTIDLSLINGKPNCGTIKVSNKLHNCKIVYESITGFYRKIIFEVK